MTPPEWPVANWPVANWIARPISPVGNVGRTEPCAVPYLRRAFCVDRPIFRAVLAVSALGVHQTTINGQPVSPDLFDPGWTEYRHRLLYSAHDVTALIRTGENVLAAAVGDGWWRGNLTWMARRAVYGSTTALLAQLEIEYADGTSQLVVTDRDWKGATGGLIAADFYNGCELDLAQEPRGWREQGFDDSGWDGVSVLPLPAGLEQRSAPAVRIIKQFEVAFEATPRIVRIDCRQTLTGYLRLSVLSDRDATITARHAEVLDEGGTLYTAALRSAKATDTYHIPAGRHVLTPSFTFHGFRYAELMLSDGVTIEKVEAFVVASDLREIGHFACSDERINQLHSNIFWSQRGNFLSIPTDCPQRDERLGWTGDIQVFAPTACTNFDCRTFLESWLVDLAHAQFPDGRVTSTVPNVIQGHDFEYGGVGWGDAATLVPWALYEAYGDSAVLARQFESMRRWVDYGASRLNTDGVWLGDFHLGDWLDPAAPPDKPELATTDRDYIASAYLAKSADVVARSAALLGKTELAKHYTRLASEMRAATWVRWRETAVTTQTGAAIAVMFDIAPADALSETGEALARLVEANHGRIATGFLGTPIILAALTRTGQHETAFRLLLNEDAPGWLYQVKRGATTMWERWDAILPDGRINKGTMAAEDAESMTSFNHYAYGSVGAWLYRSLAGIAPDLAEPGYKLIQFAPQPGGGVTWAEARLETPSGSAGIRWDESPASLMVRIEVPAGARGRFSVPAGWAMLDRSPDFPSGQHRIVLSRA